jgi:hypothetical protein
MIPPSSAKTRLPQLLDTWRSLAATLEKYGAVRTSVAVLQCAEDLEVAIIQDNDRLISLGEASDLSGYSTDHLGRLVRDGKLPNAGRKGKPLLRVGDLPRRSAKLGSPKSKRYDPDTDARFLRGRAENIA